MIAFIVAAALLTALVLGLLLPLWGSRTTTSDCQPADQRAPLRHAQRHTSPPAAASQPDRQLHRTTFALAVLLPLGAGLLYFQAGAPAALLRQQQPAQMARDPHGAAGPQGESMEDAVKALALRLRDQPADPAGWEMLARSYLALERHGEAAVAYGRLAQQVKPDAQVLADYADALASAKGQDLRGEPERLLRQALELNPQHVKSLALSGSAAFARQDYIGAERHWQRILEQAPADSPLARSTAANLAEARIRARAIASEGHPPVQAPTPTQAPAQARAPAPAPRLSGTVELAPGLTVPAGATLFIFARSHGRPGAPLVAQRLTAASFPIAFRLDDSMRMQNGPSLADAGQLEVVARISGSGKALAAKGDLEGRIGPVTAGQADLRVRIGTVK